MAHETNGAAGRQCQACYCFMWETKPEHFERQGIPRGYCGTCGICGQPGHTRAHPHAPVTGAWCDTCYEKLARSTPLWKVVRLAFCLALFAWIAYLLWRSAA
ncbi:MAG: hypothetical protein HUU46_13900 [Candidatus Hydrogenedentes bacterium]|nr:hypothetical protein [Candidatus Hydrogenedentota bacterium]